MKRMFFILIFSGISLILTNAQQFLHDFGKTSNEEFVTTKCPIDSTAEAFYIYDIGECSFSNDQDLALLYDRRFKIKILDEAGLKYSQFEIPIYFSLDGYEKIVEIEGTTYNFENGVISRTPLNTKQFYDEKIDEHWALRKFAMPEVRKGSVIEVRFRLESSFNFNYRSWEFQKYIPVLYSSYKAKMVPFYDYISIAQGISKFDGYNTYVDQNEDDYFGPRIYHKTVYDFVMNNLPSFKDADYISSPDDYMMKIDFQLSAIHQLNGNIDSIITTWPKLIDKLSENEYFGKYLKASIKSAKSVTDTMPLTLMSSNDRVKHIYNYVKRSFNWDGQVTKFTDKSVKDFLKSKKGNSAEINLYLVGLLRAVGIKAYPVILSTRANGKIKSNYPFEKYFNYVIVEVELDNKSVLLDATEPYCAFGEIPTRCINDKGLVISANSNKKVDWITYSSPSISTITDSINLYINPLNDSLCFSGAVTSSGFYALEARKSSLASIADLRKTLNIEHLNLIDSLTLSNQLAVELPFVAKFKAGSIIENVDSKIVVDPFQGIAISENLFKQSVRQYPIDMIYRKSKQYVSIIHIPDGFSVLTLPKDLNISNVLIDISYKTQYIDDKTLKIEALYTLKKDVYDSRYYQSLKGLFSVVIEKFNEKVVLAKK